MEENVKLTKLAKCAGCGAKVGAGVLAQLLEGIQVHKDPNLLVGFDKSDDASVYKVSDELALVQTLDFFPPIADDPYTFGQIAATNALSDIYAMGGDPKLALNIMCVPEDMPKDTVHQILRGGYEKVYEAGALITGGHSIFDDEPKYGLSVTGFVHPDRILTNSGAKEGDVLLLTKPIGIGILTSAMKADLCSKESTELAMRLMTTLNKNCTIYGDSAGAFSPLGMYTTEEVIATGPGAGPAGAVPHQAPLRRSDGPHRRGQSGLFLSRRQRVYPPGRLPGRGRPGEDRPDAPGQSLQVPDPAGVPQRPAHGHRGRHRLLQISRKRALDQQQSVIFL